MALIRALHSGVVASATVGPAIARSNSRDAIVSGIAVPQIADTVRPRVVGKYGRAAAQPLLDLNVHAVVVARAVIVARGNDSVVLAERRVPHIKSAPHVGIGSSGTHREGLRTGHRIQRAWRGS